MVVRNLKELENVQKNELVILGNIGAKKKIDILNKAKEMKLEIYKINPDKFVKNNAKTKENSPRVYPDKSPTKISTGGQKMNLGKKNL